jgi:hypothetical protein
VSGARQGSVVALGLVALGLAGCGSSSNAGFGDGGVDGGGGNVDGSRKADGSKHDAPPTLMNMTPSYTSLVILPTNPTITVVNGVVPPATAFKLFGKTAKGTMTPLSGATWSFDRPDLGSVDASGGFTAIGAIGGTGTLTATTSGLKATASVTVFLQMTSDPGGVASTLGPMFHAASATDPLLAFDYPYTGTIFPRGLPGPVAQWCLGVAPACSGNATDVYDIKITTPSASFEAFTTTPTPTAPSFTFPTMPVDVWTTLASSTTGAMTFSIARYDGTSAYAPFTESWTIAPADLAGTIYYWEVNEGTVVKMPVGQGPGMFLQIPTTPTPAITCVACHSVSKNGTTVVAAFNGTASPWGTFSTATGASIFVDGTDPNNGPAGSGFEAISPDGSWVLWGQEQGTSALTLSPSDAGTAVGQMTPSAGSTTEFPVNPAWSPDGNHVAFAVRTDGNWLDYTTSTLWTSDVDLAATPPTFSNTQQIVPNVPGTRPTVIYPTYSPDSSWIAFERSTQSRSRGAQAELWLTSTDGQTVISLDAANQGTGLYTQTDANYEPTFMPVAVGGYFWLVFVSERVYGNTLTDITEGTSTAPGRHKQLWVTAIDANPKAGTDPSHPAFWLPGQNTADQNMRGEWALDPCKATGAGCTGGFQCCAGFCVAGDGGAGVCTTQAMGCSSNGDACKASSDCCDPTATCIAGFCNSSPK